MAGFFKSVREDIGAVFESDPAARSYFEVLFCYPGLHAIWAHRFNLSFAKILSDREINSLQDFLKRPAWYNSGPCSASSGSGSEP